MKYCRQKCNLTPGYTCQQHTVVLALHLRIKFLFCNSQVVFGFILKDYVIKLRKSNAMLTLWFAVGVSTGVELA